MPLVEHGPALAGLEHVLDILGSERRDAADRAGSEDVGDRTADDVDRADQLGLEVEHAVRVVAGALEVLPGAVDQHVDAAEILQAANVDRRGRVIGALGQRSRPARCRADRPGASA